MAASVTLLVLVVSVTLAVWLAQAPWTFARYRLDPIRDRRFPRILVVALIAGAWCVLLSTRGIPQAILGVAAGIVVFVLWRRRQQFHVKNLRLRNQQLCVELVEYLAAELRAGSLPHLAIERLRGEFDGVEEIHRAVRSGADIAGAWNRLAARPGWESLGWVAAAWAVANESGAPLADILDAVAADVRRETELLRDVETAVAPARSTALLMAVLPLFALGMGAGMGSSPTQTITETIAGATAVALGVGLAMLGIIWVDRIVDKVEML